MTFKGALIAGIVLAGLGVAIGAFGAHALKNLLIANGRLETFELAVRYQFYHAFALMVSGILLKSGSHRSLSYAAICFCAGFVFFSGSLYLLSFTNITKLGAITPIGGILFIAGWIFLLAGVVNSK